MRPIKPNDPVFYVYRWTNTVNGKCYIGKGKGRRAWEHMLHGRQGNRTLFQKAIGKYGQGAFSLEFLKTGLTDAEALRDEILCIYLQEPEYNLTAGGDGASGAVMSAEARRKMSAAKKGKKQKPESVANATAARLLVMHTPEYRAKQAKASTGRVKSAETRAKLSAANKGRIITEEWRAKISATKTGVKLSRKFRAKWSEAQKARYEKDPEARGKVSRALKALWANPEKREEILKAQRLGREKAKASRSSNGQA